MLRKSAKTERSIFTKDTAQGSKGERREKYCGKREEIESFGTLEREAVSDEEEMKKGNTR